MYRLNSISYTGNRCIGLRYTMTKASDVFAHPDRIEMRRYEALRAYFHEHLSTAEAAARGGYTLGSFRNLCSRFRKNPSADFFWPAPDVPTPSVPPDDPRPARILALRKQHQASMYQIVALLKEEGLKASPAYVAKVLRKHGMPRLSRRTVERFGASAPTAGPWTSRRARCTPMGPACFCLPLIWLA